MKLTLNHLTSHFLFAVLLKTVLISSKISASALGFATASRRRELVYIASGNSMSALQPVETLHQTTSCPTELP